MASETIITNTVSTPQKSSAVRPGEVDDPTGPDSDLLFEVVMPPPSAVPITKPVAPKAEPAAPAAPVATQPVTNAVSPARLRPRHYGILASFVLAVVLPFVLSVAYLFVIAKEQYTSTVSFSVRSEELGGTLGLLGGLSSLSGTSSSDTDILYQFIQSQELVERIDKRLNLRLIYSKPTFDPVYAFDPSGSVEDLVNYWQDMVRIFYDRGTGLIELRVHAFDPKDAQAIATAVYEESSLMINHLSAIGRDDATRYAKEDMNRAIEEVKQARTALTDFRSRNQIADPSADVQGQMGLLQTLQQQLTSAMIDVNLLRASEKTGSDPRIQETERRIAVIEDLIAQERAKFGDGLKEGDGEGNFSTLLGQYEALNVDREFAEKAYVSTRASYDAALAKAQRQSRYLAAHVRPTLAETSRYPQRLQTSLVLLGLLLSGWGIIMLVYYSVRDRR